MVCYNVMMLLLPVVLSGDWNDIDKAERKDPLFSSEYAPDIYSYMKEREVWPHVGEGLLAMMLYV